MAKCVIFSGTRICSGSPYRVNGRATKDFPELTAKRSAMRMPVRRAINAFNVPKAQRDLANALLDAVLAVRWTDTKTANANDIHESVRLLLVNEVADLEGEFTLISY